MEREIITLSLQIVRRACICRHAKENQIQVFEYKDYNGGLQPLQHAKNGHSAYTI